MNDRDVLKATILKKLKNGEERIQGRFPNDHIMNIKESDPIIASTSSNKNQ